MKHAEKFPNHKSKNRDKITLFVVLSVCADDESTWNDVDHCDPTNLEVCDAVNGTCASSTPVGNGPDGVTGTYYLFVRFTEDDSDYRGGADVDCLNEHCFVNRDGSHVIGSRSTCSSTTRTTATISKAWALAPCPTSGPVVPTRSMKSEVAICRATLKLGSHPHVRDRPRRKTNQRTFDEEICK